jgi:hypothetical protein
MTTPTAIASHANKGLVAGMTIIVGGPETEVRAPNLPTQEIPASLGRSSKNRGKPGFAWQSAEKTQEILGKPQKVLLRTGTS